MGSSNSNAVFPVHQSSHDIGTMKYLYSCGPRSHDFRIILRNRRRNDDGIDTFYVCRLMALKYQSTLSF